MSTGPLVSVVVAFLNEERFLQEAIDSVFAQTYGAWELLLVDDGSSDASSRIARRHARQQSGRVTYLEHERHANRGLSASRNLGIGRSRGEYLAFLDADDVWLPHKLAEQVGILEAHPETGMVYGRSRWWFSWEEDTTDDQRDHLYELGVPTETVIEPPQLFDPLFISQTAAVPNPSGILVRRDLIDKVGGFEEVFRDTYEDQAFYAKVVLAAPVIASDRCWDLYRQHPASISNIDSQKGREVETRVVFLSWLAEYLDETGWTGFRRAVLEEIRSYRHPSVWARLQRSIRAMDWLLGRMKSVARAVVPAPIQALIWRVIHGAAYIPPVDLLRWGDLRRLTPLSREFGYDRGNPVDRYYIEKFLDDHREAVGGRVLEIADDNYTRRFGGEAVTQGDILHVAPGDPSATIVADLSDAPGIPADTFDCIILTQTLQVVYDVRAVIRTLHRILKPGGVALVTAPGISHISRYDMDRWGHYWSFTSLSLRKLFGEVFGQDHVTAETYGNVLTATAFLQGVATEELQTRELEYCDPDYEVIIGIRAEKAMSDA